VSTPRTRTGLAKLRGDTQQTETETATEQASPAVAEQREPVEPAAPTTPASVSPTVVLTKPAKDSQPDTIDSTEAPTAPERTPGKKGIPGRVLAALVAGVLAVAVLLTFVLRWDDQLTGSSSGSATASANGGQANSDARLAALRAARQFAVSFFTYDYRNIDAYLRRVEAASTGGFRSDFVSKEKTLKTVVAQLKTVAKGSVPEAGAGIFALSGSTAICFVAADFNASNAVTKNGQERYRVKLTLQLVKGQWLVSNFQQVL
jgi:hypothetical protein